MLDTADTMHVWRMRVTLRHLQPLGADPLRVVSEACRDHGITCQFSLRMNDRHHVHRRTVRPSPRCPTAAGAQWVRSALRSARKQEPSVAPDKKPAALRAAVRHQFPTADVDQMLAEIERGYLHERDARDPD